jgi:4-amino-4-deoxy-L-arabinose transferase-like glycosyltransferase
MPRKSSLPFWLLAASAFLIPVLPKLVAHGLFMDGLWYATISRNLAQGLGSFWRPMFTPTVTPTFFADHPPLVFGIESLFFRALGDHWWVASVYSFTSALATMALLLVLWRLAERALGEPPRVREFGWLPLLLWVATPLVTWSFSNDMLENTMGLFILLAASCFFRAAFSTRGLAWAACAGAALFAALLCKGAPGLYPLAFPMVLAFALRRPRSAALAHTLVALLVLAALAAMTWQMPEARAYAHRYIETNFLPLVSGARGAVTNRFHIVIKLLLELAPALVLTALLGAFGHTHGGGVGPARARMAGAFVLLGLAGSLPLLLSPIQSGFYLVPAFAPFAIGLAVLLKPSGAALLAWLGEHATWRRVLTTTFAVILAFTLSYCTMRLGSIGRGGTTIEDVLAIGHVVPRGATVGICPASYREWSLHGYFMLYDRITLDANSAEHEWFVGKDCAPPPGFARQSLRTSGLVLYRASSLQ